MKFPNFEYYPSGCAILSAHTASGWADLYILYGKPYDHVYAKKMMFHIEIRIVIIIGAIDHLHRK